MFKGPMETPRDSEVSKGNDSRLSMLLGFVALIVILLLVAIVMAS